MTADLDQRVPARLPLLDALRDEWATGQPLRGWTALLIQHQLGSQVAMTRTLIDLGIEPGRIYWVDIPYTANATVYDALCALDIPPGNFAPSYYNLDLAYAPYQHERVQEMALRLTATLGPSDRLLVLDDGAYFAEALANLSSAPPDVRIVEQTTRGIIKMRDDATLRAASERTTVVNVAESLPKKEIEGPLIGEAVRDRLVKRLGSELSRDGDLDCLVLGAGSIGTSVATALSSGLGIAPGRIAILDPSPEAQEAARASGFRIWSRLEPDEAFDVVVGCSGTTSFGVGDRTFLNDEAVLVTASSGSAELSRDGFIELVDTHPGQDVYMRDRDLLCAKSVHDDIRIHLVDRDVRFLNGGFPINFDGAVNCVPPHLIQATHALQVGAAVEATRSDTRGLVPVSDELCEWVTRRFGEITGLHGP